VPTPWNDDPPASAAQIASSIRAVGDQIVADAPLRLVPSVAMAQHWHRDIYRGVVLPVAYYAGEVRDSDPAYPELIDYEVAVGTAVGVPATDVPDALIRYEAAMQAVVARMDGVIAAGSRPTSTADLYAVLEVAALAHGEWVRIHPFANGNGRVARLWVNWVAVRYGLPFFLSLRPRPAALIYAAAAAASMRGDHQPMVVALLTLLNQHIGP
jgi:fido (protein-threonine AMPylation protein)